MRLAVRWRKKEYVWFVGRVFVFGWERGRVGEAKWGMGHARVKSPSLGGGVGRVEGAHACARMWSVSWSH